MERVISTENITDFIPEMAGIISSIMVIFGVILGIHKWYLTRQEKDAKHDQEIERIKKENALIIYALSACLDGLEQLGANHSVPVAREKLVKHLNIQAHK